MKEEVLGNWLIRPERPKDVAAIWKVQNEAFGRPDEADLVNLLRRQQSLSLSLVAVYQKEVVGHIAFSPVRLEPPAGTISLLGLAPLAVLPDCQMQGIGKQLVWAGLNQCRQQGHQGVVVLGSPNYYTPFGFSPAEAFGLRCTFPVPPPLFMAQELQPGSLAGINGPIHYHPAFYD